MEKVRVVKPVPGILKVGDILVSPVAGDDFCLNETEVKQAGASERFVSLDYVTVSENVPQFFVFEHDEPETEVEPEELELGEPEMNFAVSRTNESILKRREFFEQQFAEAYPGSEAQIVYQNLIWFIDWLTGKVNLI